MRRNEVLRIVVPTTVVLAVGSLVLAFIIRLHTPSLKDTVGYTILGLWALIPPIWFFLEWTFLCKGVSDAEANHIQHLHDLARNIWLSLVLVLAAIMRVSWPFS